MARARKKKITPLLGAVLQKIAPKIGAKVFVEPTWGVVGQITFKSGRKRYFRYSTLDLNPVGASDIAKDKDYANFFMKHMGYPTVIGKAFYSNRWAHAIGSIDTIDAGYRFAQKIGFPVIVKPNSGSQGTGVTLVHTKKDFYRFVRQIFTHDKVALVQKHISGTDYRIVVLDDKIISAYERIPLSIEGDGKKSISELLIQKQKTFIDLGRDTLLRYDDPRIKKKLHRARLTYASIPTKHEKIFLLDNANLSTGGDAKDVTAQIHPAFRNIAIKLTQDMGLRLCGVDLLIDGEITHPPKKYVVLEINAAPGLDHYAKSGKAQEKIVEDLYLEVLKSMEK